MSSAEHLLQALEAAGIRLQLQGQELKVQAPKGSLTPERQAAIREHKAALISLLQPLRMNFSLFFFGVEADANAGETYQLLIESARLADRKGFSGIWTPERHFHPLGGPFPNPAVLAAALATQTERLKLRAGSVVLPLHDPLRVAEEWAVVDQLSGGRVELSFASGWHSNDFALAPGHYAQRHPIMMERVEQVRALWRGDALQRETGSGQMLELHSFPRPRQPDLPIWLTAIGNPAAYQRTGQAGYHLLTALLDQSIEELSEKLKGYRAALVEGGLTPDSRQVAVFMHSYLGADREAVRQQVKVPFQNYLRQSLHLISNLGQSLGLGLDPSQFSEADRQSLLDFAFTRYFDERALLGDLSLARQRVRQLMQAGVQEIACLVDFGLPPEQVLSGLQTLAQLVAECQP